MTKPLPLTDFRAVRHVLTADEYATGGEFPPPSDLIDQKLWHNIMDLPDDVAIRISDHNGTRLSMLYSLWGDWIVAVGDPVGKQDELFGCMLDANDCLQCANFDFLHGFYRAAIANFRTAFELVIIGTYGNLLADAKYQAWKSGGNSKLMFTPCRQALARALKGKPAAWIFADRGLLAALYAELCEYTHARPNASDGALWQSNGPVYNNEAIRKTFLLGLDVYAAAYLMVKTGRPDFRLPEDSIFVFELDWMTRHADALRAFKELYRQP